MKSISSYFHSQGLLQQALTHRSYCNEHPGLQSNERLEFLGDAVLSLVVSQRLYRLHPDSPEGELTARRSALVQTATLAGKAKLLQLTVGLLLSRGEEDSGGRSNLSLLANTFEAVLGALYLDRGLKNCEKYLNEVFADSELISDANPKDPKSWLQERAQAEGLGTPVYLTLSASGPDHAKKFTVGVHVGGREVGVGTGSSKQRAETAAAAAAIAKPWPK